MARNHIGWSNAEKIIVLTLSSLPFSHRFPLEEIGGHMFAKFPIRNRCAIVVNRHFIGKYPYSRSDDSTFIESKEKSSSIIFFECGEKGFVVRSRILGKSITRSGISEYIHPDIYIFARSRNPLCRDSSTFCQPNIVSTLLVHLTEQDIFSERKIDHAGPRLEKVFSIGRNIFHHACIFWIIILYLPKKSSPSTNMMSHRFQKSIRKRDWISPERKCPHHPESDRTIFDQDRESLRRKKLCELCLSRKRKNISPQMTLPKRRCHRHNCGQVYPKEMKSKGKFA